MLKKFKCFFVLVTVINIAHASLQFTNETGQAIPVPTDMRFALATNASSLINIQQSTVETLMFYFDKLEFAKKRVRLWDRVEFLSKVVPSPHCDFFELLELVQLFDAPEIKHALARIYLKNKPKFNGSFDLPRPLSQAVQNTIRTQWYLMTDNREIMEKYNLTLSFHELVTSKKLVITNRKINLSNSFLGSLDGIEFYQGTPLQQLDVSHNSLQTIPEAISQLPELNVLIAHHNQIKMFPDTIGNLSKLTKLDLSYNKLTTLPENFGNLENLWRLNVSHNKLTTLPKSVGNLENLHWLWINNNDLQEIPESLTRLPKLKKLITH